MLTRLHVYKLKRPALSMSKGSNLTTFQLSNDQHRIPKRIKAIIFFDGSFICFENLLTPRKRADQHQQRGLGQVKVCNHHIHDFELIARENEQLSWSHYSRHNTYTCS